MQLPVNIISNVIGAQFTGKIDDTLIKYLLTDSRDLTYPDSTLFFALRSDGNDGHNYIQNLYDNGVRHFVIDHDIEPMPDDCCLMRVPKVLDALQQLAAYVRQLCNDTLVIGITGSRGKTVVKEQLYSLLAPYFDKIVRSPRSYNSQIGVPLSVWEMNPDDRIAIFEAGISLPGEMTKLSEIIRPQIGIFTSLTNEHDDGFPSLSEKAAEKALLFASTPVVFVANGYNSAIFMQKLARTNDDVDMRLIDGSNVDMARTAARYIINMLRPDDNDLSALDKASVPYTVSSRIDVTETLKDCVIVYDSFTNDLRSLLDGLNLARRHLTPGLKLTAILTDIKADTNDIMQMLIVKGVSRVISVGRVLPVNDTISVENIDCVAGFVNNYSISDFDNELILLKGDSSSGAEDIKTLLEAPRHETVMEVDLGAIIRNYNFFRAQLAPNTGIVAMVKAGGYGIGSVALSKVLQNQGAAYLAVAVIDEGVELRRAGITMPIIVMNPIGTNYKALFDNKLEPSIFSLRELNMIVDNAMRLGMNNYPIHIKLDTGMHRLGFLADEIPALLNVLSSQRYLKVASIFSHLATADCLDQNDYTELQLSRFEQMSTTIMQALPYRVKRHILNTAGILRYPQYQYDMVRLGIGLYGVAPIDGYKLDTVARLLTTIISIKQWQPGDTIGYGRRGVLTRPSTIATVPIGYADGLNRHLSNGVGKVVVRGKLCPIIGNICMDQCMIDITDTGAVIGDKVEIFGSDYPITNISDTLGTIPYEILTSVSTRVKRIYFRD